VPWANEDVRSMQLKVINCSALARPLGRRRSRHLWQGMLRSGYSMHWLHAPYRPGEIKEPFHLRNRLPSCMITIGEIGDKDLYTS
jgi:hypothetical protein